MKKTIKTLAATFLISTSAFANDSAMQSFDANQSMQSMEQSQFVPSFEQPEASFGNDFGLWCQDSIRVLRRARLDALNAYAFKRYGDALQYLFNGLQRAGDDIQPYHTGALTAQAIMRGQTLYNEISQAIEVPVQDLASVSRREQRAINHKRKTLIHFLFDYYDFVKEVSENLDMKYYSTRHRGYHRGNDHRTMDRLFVMYSKQQVRMVINSLTEYAYNRQGNYVAPVGDTAAYLKGLELSTQYLYEDLEDSIHSARYACKILDLQDLNATLMDYNDTRKTRRPIGYLNDFHAVQASHSFARDILDYGMDCGGYDSTAGDYDWDLYETTETETVKSWSFKLNDSRPLKTISVDSSRAIKSIYIVAEGYDRNGGEFDVMVNGNAVRNVYVPGKDPFYFHNFQSPVYTSDISLARRWGKIKVKRIEVVYVNGIESSGW